MNNKATIFKIKKLIAASKSNSDISQALANKFHKKQFGLSIIAEEAVWGLMYHARALTTILEQLEDSDAPPKSNKQAKSKVQRRPSMGNRKVLD